VCAGPRSSFIDKAQEGQCLQKRRRDLKLQGLPEKVGRPYPLKHFKSSKLGNQARTKLNRSSGFKL
jgi:hypothetical protein